MSSDYPDALVMDTPDQIRHFQLCSIKGRLKLEIDHPTMGFSMPTLPAVKRMFPDKGIRTKVQALKVIEDEIAEMERKGVINPN